MAAPAADIWGIPPFTAEALMKAFSDACAKAWDEDHSVPSVTLPEGVLPAVASLVSTVTRDVVTIRRVPMFTRERGGVAAPAREAALSRVAALAQAQRQGAVDLRDAVTAAHAAGASWSELGRAAGMVRETLFRQVKAGSPVVVVKASHKMGTDDPA